MSNFCAARGRRVMGFICAIALIASGCMEESYEEKHAAGEIDLPDDLYSVTAIGADHMW